MALTNLTPGQTMQLTDNVTYSIFNDGIAYGVSSYGAYTVSWADPPLEIPYSIGPSSTTTLDIKVPGNPPTEATLVNAGGTTLQVSTSA
jgi:hypothetical protein